MALFPNGGGGVLLADFLRQYPTLKLGIKPESIRQMEITVGLFERWLGRPAGVEDLLENPVRCFLAYYSGLVRPATVNAKRRHLLALGRAAYEEGLLSRPCRKVAPMRENLAAPQAWSVHELRAILRACRKLKGKVGGVEARWWWESIIRAAYETGFRISSLLKVPSDTAIDQLYVRPEDTKSGRGLVRHVSRKTMVAILHAYEGRGGSDRIWVWPYSREWLAKSFHRILKMAGVDGGRGKGGLFHKIRRSSGSLLESAGGDGAALLGNSRAVFEKHYLDPSGGSYLMLKKLPRLN